VPERMMTPTRHGSVTLYAGGQTNLLDEARFTELPLRRSRTHLAPGVVVSRDFALAQKSGTRKEPST